MVMVQTDESYHCPTCDCYYDGIGVISVLSIKDYEFCGDKTCNLCKKYEKTLPKSYN